MRFPTSDRYVSSPFGWRTHPVTGLKKLHAGADFPLPGAGAALVAVLPWTFHSKGKSWGGGNWVCIRLSDGVLAYYYHMQAPSNIGPGQKGAEGAIVGRMGATGFLVTGAHLHFETRRADGTPFDPVPYLTQGSASGGGSTPFPPVDPDQPTPPPIVHEEDEMKYGQMHTKYPGAQYVRRTLFCPGTPYFFEWDSNDSTIANAWAVQFETGPSVEVTPGIMDAARAHAKSLI